MITNNYISRFSEAYFDETAKYYPIISISGPRQAGKTSFIKAIRPDYKYISFEDIDNRNLFQSDPRGFLMRYNDKVIFDEAQKVPSLFSYLQTNVDQDRRNQRFVLSGSQNYLIQRGIGQSLAGRVGLVKLFPFQLAELRNTKFWNDDHISMIHRGFYPGCIVNDIPPRMFYANYISTLLERDIAEYLSKGNLRNFRIFMKVCANYAGSQINLTDISNHLNVSIGTISNWISILETSYIVFFLQPYYRNFNKRLMKTPKIYFNDTGLLCFLLGIKSSDQLFVHKKWGHIFENFIIVEKFKKAYHRGDEIELYYLRDSNGVEIDLVEDKQDGLVFYEIKSSRTYNTNFIKNLYKFNDRSINIERKLIYGGDDTYKINDVEILSWRELI